MNILFFYPSNQPSNVLESQMIYFKQQGHVVHLLTIAQRGLLHQKIEDHEITANSLNISIQNRFRFYYSCIRNLVKYIKENKIEILYSHLQQANLISMLAQNRIKSTKIIVCRHHHDRVMKGNSMNAKIFDYIINKRAKFIIVPSALVYKQVVNIEKVDSKKVFLIPYTYNFNLFPKPSKEITNEIKKSFLHDLTGVVVTRLVKGKGIEEILQVTKNLNETGFDFGLIIVGDGELNDYIKEYISANNLTDKILLTGHINNVIDYINSVDLMILLSNNEASNNVVKEAAFCEKTSIVCKGVGDFDDYIINGVNGFSVEKENKVEQTIFIIKKIFKNKKLLLSMGIKLRDCVISKFSIENNIDKYNQFHK